LQLRKACFLAQPLDGEVLIIGDDFKPEAAPCQLTQGRQGPGGNAVGVDRNGDSLHLSTAARSPRRQVFEITLQVSPQQPRLQGVFEQQTARRCWLQRTTAHNQNRAHLDFERAQAL
jgi:hypothetical protein